LGAGFTINATWGLRPDAHPVRLALSIAMVAVATGVAAVLQDVLRGEQASGLFLISVMMAAAVGGIGYGVLASLLAAVAYDFFIETPRFTTAIGSPQDAANLIMFLAGAWLAGAYTEALRGRREGAQALYAGARGLSLRSPDALQTIVEAAPFSARAWARGEAVGLGAAMALVVAAIAVALGAQLLLRTGQTGLPFVAAVAVAAIWLGLRFAMASAAVSVFACNFLFAGGRFGFHAASPQDVINLVVLCGVAWLVGAFADRVRHEREALGIIFEAGERMTAVRDEQPLRQFVCQTLSEFSVGAPAYVWPQQPDEVAVAIGAPPPEEVVEAGAALPLGKTLTLGSWRARKLGAPEEALGVAFWSAPTGRRASADLDQAAGVFVDRAAAALAQLRVDEIRAEELNDALIASVSHDFRTPLTGILGAATSLLDYPEAHDAPAARDMLLNIKEQAQRLRRYMENLIATARLDAHALKVRAEPVLLASLVCELWEELADVDGRHRQFDLRVDDEAAALADPVLIRQALANVIDNAIKFSPRDSVVTFEATQREDRVVLEIRDQGPGLPPMVARRLFDRFYRAPNAHEGGTGLGLYIARSFVESQDGRVYAGARVDGGTGLAVEFDLPSATRQRP
jgi:two-component system sensor histidine kinase KdpD